MTRCRRGLLPGQGPARGLLARAWRSWARSDRDRGSAAVEAAVLAPAVLALIGVAIVGGRIQVSGAAIETAAHDAARAASISRTAAQARTAAHAAADATLTQTGLHCARLTVAVDTAGEVPRSSRTRSPIGFRMERSRVDVQEAVEFQS
jgi:Flp pilus assembly protein TadG